jgi:transglutaminase-like putative cysteine protease
MMRPALSASTLVLALLVVVLASHVPALPPLLLLLLPAALAMRRLPAARWAPFARLALLAGGIVHCGLAFGWLDNATLRSALLLALALKWAEARAAREFQLLAAAALVAGAIGALQWSDGAGLALLALEFLLALAVFEILQAPPPDARELLRLLRGHLARALPLAAVLFLFFPRIPGPLWDIGLSFGLPLSLAVEKSNQGLGVSTRLKPGDNPMQTGVRESQPVLVAEFENWVPPTGSLYWRGPVYYDYDGDEWRLDAEYDRNQGRMLMRRGWTTGAAFSATLSAKGREIRYRIRLTPHDRLWLYGLDLPARLDAESFVGPDWQVLSHTAVERETQYELSSWLNWEGGGTLPDELRARALTLPPDGNPELRALGRQLADEHGGRADAIARAAMVGLGSGYALRARFEMPTGPDALDEFWFRTRSGDAAAYASAFAWLMRAAGVPARLVAGYRGGKLMALTDYVVVKRSHAHAWVEIWDEAGGRGWRRFDPTDMIAPERFAGASARPQPAPAAAPQPAPSGAAPERPPAGDLPAPVGNLAAAPTGLRGAGWELPDIAGWLARWIFKLDGDTQKLLLGGSGGGFAWAWLLGAAVGLSGLILGVHALLARWRDRRRIPAPRRAWETSLELLARHGVAALPGECPSRFAARAGALRPAWATALHALAGAYTDWRYAAATAHADAPTRVVAAARHLHNLVLAGVDTRRPPA